MSQNMGETGSSYEPTLNDMESSIGVRVFSFLTPRDASRASSCSRKLQVIASEELLWRIYSLRSFPDIAKEFQPEDESWIAEYRWRTELKRRTVSYQKAQMMGMTGYRKGKELIRIKPHQRFAAFEGGPTARRRAALIEKRREEEIESKREGAGGGEEGGGGGEVSEQRGLSPLAQGTLDKIDAASRRPRDYIESRQGTATWAALSGNLSGII
jgi:hypothetical protein